MALSMHMSKCCLHFDLFRQRVISAMCTVKLLTDRPERADLVGAVAETTGTWSLHQLRDRMRSDPEGRRILDERPRVTVSETAVCRGIVTLTSDRA